MNKWIKASLTSVIIYLVCVGGYVLLHRHVGVLLSKWQAGEEALSGLTITLVQIIKVISQLWWFFLPMTFLLILAICLLVASFKKEVK